MATNLKMGAMDSDLGIEKVKAELERAYERLRSLPPGDDTDQLLVEIERLERDLLDRYASYVAKRDSTRPPKKS
jgi:hypothetical protein